MITWYIKNIQRVKRLFYLKHTKTVLDVNVFESKSVWLPLVFENNDNNEYDLE